MTILFQGDERSAGLVNEIRKLCEIFESKIQRRVHKVPKKFAELKIKDVLNVERDHKIKIYQLISDIEAYKKSNNRKINDDEQMRLEIAQLRRKKADNLRSLQKRKESIATTGRVSKPKK